MQINERNPREYQPHNQDAGLDPACIPTCQCLPAEKWYRVFSQRITSAYSFICVHMLPFSVWWVSLSLSLPFFYPQSVWLHHSVRVSSFLFFYDMYLYMTLWPCGKCCRTLLLEWMINSFIYVDCMCVLIKWSMWSKTTTAEEKKSSLPGWMTVTVN